MSASRNSVGHNMATSKPIERSNASGHTFNILSEPPKSPKERKSADNDLQAEWVLFKPNRVSINDSLAVVL